MDIAWSKGRKDVMNKKQLTAEVKNIQQKLASREPVVLEDNRLLVFRLTAGNNKVAYDAYTDVGNNDDEGYRANVRCGCLTVNGSLPCETHYRSRLLDHWPSSVIDTVRVSVYENDEEKAFVEFDGEGSTYLDWWSADRVVASSWADLLTQKRFETQSGAFSIAG
nr:hypothetical protein BaRGS_009564 [Batillaria attramentaria]